ncbi:MAG: hypothetical protein WC293_06395 [Candidatus Omnitrophota bacterium]|jgi:hypothetical protein
MKFKVQRKLNLANIDKDLWPYETEDIGIEDADSFEEAQQMVDKLVAERIGYYKAKSEEYHKYKSQGNNVQQPLPSVSAPAAAPITSNPVPANPAGSTGGMPAEFQV